MVSTPSTSMTRRSSRGRSRRWGGTAGSAATVARRSDKGPGDVGAGSPPLPRSGGAARPGPSARRCELEAVRVEALDHPRVAGLGPRQRGSRRPARRSCSTGRRRSPRWRARNPAIPRVVERFELYADGLELANAFGELTDPVEQRRRFEDEARTRAARGRRTVYPIDEALLAALPRMPPTAGIALGFDRLVMLVLGIEDIAEVVAFGGEALIAIPITLAPLRGFLLCVSRLEAVVTHFLNGLAQAAAPSGGGGRFASAAP